MEELDLNAWFAELDQRKRELGIADTEEYTEAMRNKGGNRTPEKRELLRRMAERARAAGKTPIKAYY